MLLLKKQNRKIVVTPKNIDKFLGVRQFDYGVAEKENQVGEVSGLAWTEVGGELLTVEAVAVPGKGQIIRTGTLGRRDEGIHRSGQNGCPQPCQQAGYQK